MSLFPQVEQLELVRCDCIAEENFLEKFPDTSLRSLRFHETTMFCSEAFLDWIFTRPNLRNLALQLGHSTIPLISGVFHPLGMSLETLELSFSFSIDDHTQAIQNLDLTENTSLRVLHVHPPTESILHDLLSNSTLHNLEEVIIHFGSSIRWDNLDHRRLTSLIRKAHFSTLKELVFIHSKETPCAIPPVMPLDNQTGQAGWPLCECLRDFSYTNYEEVYGSIEAKGRVRVRHVGEDSPQATPVWRLLTSEIDGHVADADDSDDDMGFGLFD